MVELGRRDTPELPDRGSDQGALVLLGGHAEQAGPVVSIRGWTYIVVDEPAGKFKIGTTQQDLRKYIEGLEHRDGRPLKLFGHFRQGRDREREMHKAFIKYRLPHGEWFDWHDFSEEDVRAYLKAHGGELGWPRPDAAKQTHHQPPEDHMAYAVQITLPGQPYPRRAKSKMLRRQLDGARIPDTCQTGEVSYYTPRIYADAARLVMGRIDLDPASCEDANKTIRAAAYYDAEMDGLKQQWSGRIFLNPPWSGEAKKFVQALLGGYRSGHIEQAILVLNASYTDRSYMKPVLDNFPVCFTDHRVQYGGAGRAGTGGTMFVYFGKHQQRFVDVFTQFGYVMKRLQESHPDSAAPTVNRKRKARPA